MKELEKNEVVRGQGDAANRQNQLISQEIFRTFCSSFCIHTNPSFPSILIRFRLFHPESADCQGATNSEFLSY